MTTKILIYIILFLLMMLAICGFTINGLRSDRDRYKNQLEVITLQSEENYKKHKEKISSYEYAIDEITNYYNETINQIDNFTKDEHETECDASIRLLNSVKY